MLKRTVEELMRLCVKWTNRTFGEGGLDGCFYKIMGRPRLIKLLIALEDTDTIKWFDFFCCCHNFKMLKNVVTYHHR